MHLVLLQRILLIYLALVTVFIEANETNETNETHAKIVGGRKIQIKEVPYQVSIRKRNEHEYQFGKGHICGGAVISQRMVCSAAHCFAMWVPHSILYCPL